MRMCEDVSHGNITDCFKVVTESFFGQRNFDGG